MISVESRHDADWQFARRAYQHAGEWDVYVCSSELISGDYHDRSDLIQRQASAVDRKARSMRGTAERWRGLRVTTRYTFSTRYDMYRLTPGRIPTEME